MIIIYRGYVMFKNTRLSAKSLLGLMVAASFSAPSFANDQLQSLIDWAVEHDSGRQQIHYQAEAMQEMGIAQGQLMDPKLKMGVGGFPVENMGFDNDPMTNISVGLMQQFGRGDTLELLERQAFEQASSIREKAEIRQLDIEKAITTLWVELHYQQQAQKLLKQNQQLFRSLEKYLSTNYGVGVNQTQDIIQSQLQISRIGEKIQANSQMQQKIRAQLGEWLGDQASNLSPQNDPNWAQLSQSLNQSHSNFYPLLAQHPTVKAIDALIKSNETGIDIANEAYKPQFGVEVMYGYRQAKGMNGDPASDLVSAYVTMDLPLFTDKRQDKKLSAAKLQLGATQSQKDLMLKQMNAQAQALFIDRQNITERLGRYNSTLLRQAKEKTRAIERGYQNNTTQLDEYIRAASEELTLQLEQQRLHADLQLANTNLAYLLNKY